jgi:hypothetical protein
MVKKKIFGLILIIIGLLPFLLKIQSIGNYFSEYKFLTYLTPGEIVYQAVIIVIGVLLIFTVRPRIETTS